MYKSEIEALNMLQRLHRNRYVAGINTLLDSYKNTFSALTGPDLAVFDRIVNDLNKWKSIEEIHGIGAVLNTTDPSVFRFFSNPPAYVKLPECILSNAIRYQESVGVTAV